VTPADVLVTGATGFVGRALVARLRSQGRRVRVFVRRVPEWMRGDLAIEVVTGDLTDAGAVDGAIADVPVVHHLGATTKGTPAAILAGTVRGTQNVVDACVRRGVRRLVYVSSLSVLDHAGRDPEAVVTETSAIEPHPERRGPYTQAKLAAERCVLDAVRTRGLAAVLIRPGQVVGPGAEQVTPNATVLVAGAWVAVGPGRQTLPLVYVEDLTDALMLAESRPGLEGRVIHVVDPEPVTHAEYLACCRDAPARRRRTIRVPGPLFLLIASGIGVVGQCLTRSVPINRYRAKSLHPLCGFDLTAATVDLGWKPTVGIREGLRRTFG
jgi:2-alkyl-3-oxoalkanoate reductase